MKRLATVLLVAVTIHLAWASPLPNAAENLVDTSEAVGNYIAKDKQRVDLTWPEWLFLPFSWKKMYHQPEHRKSRFMSWNTGMITKKEIETNLKAEGLTENQVKYFLQLYVDYVANIDAAKVKAAQVKAGQVETGQAETAQAKADEAKSQVLADHLSKLRQELRSGF